MKAVVWLTILQVAAAKAVPRGQVCRNSNLSSGTELGWAPTTTSRIIPRSTVDERQVLTTAELGTSPVREGYNGVIFGPDSKALVSIGSQTVSGKNDQAQLTSRQPLMGGIFFAPVRTSSVFASVPVVTASTSSGTAQILLPLHTQVPQTTGVVITSLNTTGQPTSAPIISTSISKPTTTLSPTGRATSVTTSVLMGSTSNNIFQPVATDAPPSVIGSRSDHPVPRLGIQPQQAPISTNKFYANFFLGSQTAGTWTHPYSVTWSKGVGSSQSWGMSVQHIDADQRVYGPNATANPVEFFINPIGIQSLVLSALELGASTTLSMDTLTAFSVNVNLLPSLGAAPTITFPLVQGMGFVTGIYNGGTPVLQTGILFRSITRATSNPKPGVTKYTILLEDGKSWLLYASSSDGNSIEFTVVNSGLAQATSNFNGFIQIAKNPGGGAEALYDAACGTYATTATLSGNVNNASGSYTLSFSKGGMASTTLLMFALPHHTESFSLQTASAATNIQLQTTTKGLATAVVADSWTMVESLPTTMGSAPWSPSTGAQSLPFSAATIRTILSVAQSEVSQNMSEQSNLNSMYYSGKVSLPSVICLHSDSFVQALAKFAGIVYTIHNLLGNTALAQAGLTNLKQSYALFASNQQQYPLVHETAWGGVVSTASYVTGNSGVDFGNTYYNDHHFQYYPLPISYSNTNKSQ
jgi:endo-1,3(4)-beta-glucanase